MNPSSVPSERLLAPPWLPIASAPKDGSLFVWLRWSTLGLQKLGVKPDLASVIWWVRMGERDPMPHWFGLEIGEELEFGYWVPI